MHFPSSIINILHRHHLAVNTLSWAITPFMQTLNVRAWGRARCLQNQWFKSHTFLTLDFSSCTI